MIFRSARQMKTLKVLTLALCSFLLIQTGTSEAQFSQKPVPMWEGVERSAADLENDKNFVREAVNKAEGSRKHAVRILVNTGWRRIGEGDPNHAIRAFNQAWLVDPDEPTVFWGFAVATHMRGDKTVDVVRWFNRTRALMVARKITDNANLEVDQGRVLESRGEDERARAFFERAIELDPKHVSAHVGMIKVARALGDAKLEEAHQQEFEKLSGNRLPEEQIQKKTEK